MPDNPPISPATPPDDPPLSRSFLRGLGWLALAALFVAACCGAAVTGIRLAHRGQPAAATPEGTIPSGVHLTLGQDGHPLYLAETTEALRRFHLEFPDEQSRLLADLNGMGVRRLRGEVEATTLRSVSDAVQLRIASGAIAGSIYWIRRKQLPALEELNPIITPLPE